MLKRLKLVILPVMLLCLLVACSSKSELTEEDVNIRTAKELSESFFSGKDFNELQSIYNGLSDKIEDEFYAEHYNLDNNSAVVYNSIEYKLLGSEIKEIMTETREFDGYDVHSVMIVSAVKMAVEGDMHTHEDLVHLTTLFNFIDGELVSEDRYW